MNFILKLFKREKPQDIFSLPIKKVRRYSKRTFTRQIAKDVFFVEFWKTYHLQKEKGSHVQDCWEKAAML